MIATLLSRATRSPRGRLALAGAALAGAAVLSVSPGPIAPAAARAALVVAALGALLALARRRAARPADAPALAVVARASLGKETGVALLDVSGRRILVGFGPGGVSVLGGAAAPDPEVQP